ncbi:MAG: diacylglyceryl transferase [Flavobacteriaceae bacterium]|nr:diacylglyceryl transferase [Flavobacteriaceae bacterium]
MEKLKKRWGLTSNWQVLIILLVFSITGYTSLLIAKPILNLVGLSQETTNPWIYRPLRILLIFPFYQILIVVFGWLFGQFEFFWSFEKKMLRRIGFKRFFKEDKAN